MNPKSAITFVLLIVGIAATWYLYRHTPRDIVWPQSVFIWSAVALALGLWPSTRRVFVELLLKIQNPTARKRAIVTLVIAIVAGLYLYSTAVWQKRDFVPRGHDEFMHML